MLRVTLIIALIAGLAAAVLNFTLVREKLVTTMNDRDSERSQKEQALTELADTRQTLATTEEDLASTRSTLATTQADLQQTRTRADTQERRANTLAADLAGTRTELASAQQELEQWRQFELTPLQVRGVIADLKSIREERDAFVEENQILLKENRRIQNRLDGLVGDDFPPDLPRGLKGTVVAVDPKYDFVVLNIGADDGVLERGEMLVNRDGRFIAKVKIAAVETSRSVANIMPAWKESDVQEGDQVFY